MFFVRFVTFVLNLVTSHGRELCPKFGTHCFS